MSDTPEIDSIIVQRLCIHKRDSSIQHMELIDAEVARKLKRERDEAREQNAKMRYFAERILLNCETLHPNTVKLHRAELEQIKEGAK